MESRHRYVPVDWFESYMDESFCLFYLQDIDSLRKARLRTIHTMLLDHLDKEETPPEDYKSFSPARANLLVVILWLLGLREEALEEAKSAMRAHPTSISARSNMAYILWMSNEKYKSYEILKGLKYCKTNNPKKWKHLLTTAEAQTAYCYTKLGSSYMSHAIKHFEKVTEERPLEDVWKYTLALNLRQLERERYLTQQVGITVSQAQSKVFDLLVKVKDNKRNSKELRALAAAELGQMLNFLKGENVPVLKNKAEKLRLNAEKCYKYCLEVNGENTSILCRAGIFYRYNGDLEQSRVVLEKAVRLKPTPTSHFQLGLTYKKMAAKMKENNQTFNTSHRPQTGNYREQTRRPGTKLKTLDRTERLMKSPEHEQFFKHDPFVAETLEQFQTALKLSNSEDLFVAYDLGLMYKSLSEYYSALDTFQRIIQVEEDYFKAFEQSALVYLEMRKSVSEVQRSNQFMEMAHSMLRMAIVCQCRLFENYRKNHFYNKWIWQSFGTIGEYYKKSRLVNVVVQEEWLLKLIKRYDNDLMVLKDIVTYEMRKEDAHNSKELKAKIEGYMTRKQFEDGVVFLCLQKLTDQRKWLSLWKDLDLEFKVFVHGARGILLRNATACDSHTMNLNSLAARRIFRLTYENRSDVMFEYLNRSEIPQIMIVYDLSDESAVKSATVVQCLLSKVCGLRTTCLHNYDTNLHDQGKNKACQLLHVVNKGADVSPEFRRRLKRSVKIKQRRNNVKGRSSWLNTYHQRRVLTLSLGSARIPDPLQEYPSLLWEPERLEACSNSQSMSRDAVNAICELFCFLLGITIKLDD